MPWLQLKFFTTAEQAERIADLLDAHGAVSVTMQDSADQPVYEPTPGSTPLWGETTVVGLFSEEIDETEVITAMMHACGTLPAYHAERLQDQDWVRAWEADFRPMQFGKRLWIIPSHSEIPAGAEIPILLDPGLAFGTGTHPTTAMCLTWLDQYPPHGLELIDYGCGSGILALAACKLGARRVIAMDIDPQALLATEDNAAKNGVAQCITTVLPAGLTRIPVDVVLANILANPLCELAEEIAQRVKPGGRLALSGILAEQAQEVIHAYSPWLALTIYRQEGDWVCLHGVRS